MARLSDEFFFAVGFLTTLPTRTVVWQGDLLSRAGRWFGLVGLLIGAILLAAQWLLAPWLPALPLAALLLALWAGLTGFLHLDGLADCGDGLLVPVSRERRFVIMQDSRVGAFGAVTLGLALLLKFSVIATLPVLSLGWLLAPSLARGLVLIAARTPVAGDAGLGNPFAATLTNTMAATGLALPLLLALLLGWPGIVGLLLAAAVTAALCRLGHVQLGGVTGDLFGAIIELSEVAILLAFSAHG